jgi:hypothetical protein
MSAKNRPWAEKVAGFVLSFVPAKTTRPHPTIRRVVYRFRKTGKSGTAPLPMALQASFAGFAV